LDEKSFTLPDDLLDKYLTDTSEDAAEDPELDADVDAPEADAKDTDEPEADAKDTDEADAGDTDPEDPEDEDKDDESEDTDEPEDESFLPKFDRKKIEANPELNAAYKHMQAAFTKKQQEVSQERKEVQVQRAELQAFVDELSTDEGAEDLLVQVALNRPDVFNRAVERASELSDDPDELKKYERGQDLKRRESEISRRERLRELEEQERRANEIESLIDRTASRLGMSASDLRIAHEYVANEIFKIRSAGGNDIDAESIVKAVKRAAGDLNVTARRVREEAEREGKLKERQRAKDKVKANRRPAPARSNAPPAARRQRGEPPKGSDPLMWAIEQAFADE
jgi:hypothetical protein